MKKNLIQALSTTALFSMTFMSAAAVNPITVTYQNGTTSFPKNTPGTANYVVAVNARVIPPNVPLTFSLTNTAASPGLNATQMTTGASPCSGVNTLCGTTFSLTAGQSCCLALSLSSSTAGNYTLQPTINTTSLTYPAKVSSPTNVTVLNEPPIPLNINAPGVIPIGSSQSNAGTITVTNSSNNRTAHNIKATLPASWISAGVIQNANNCMTILPNQSCTLSFYSPRPATAFTAQAIPVAGDDSTQVMTALAFSMQGFLVYAVNRNGVDVIDSQDSDMNHAGIIWSSNGAGGAQANVSYDIIPGIDQQSTTTTGSPLVSGGSLTTPTFDNMFNASSTAFYTYSNATPSISFTSCNGAIDGQCNSNNIHLYYDQYITNYNSNGTPPFRLTNAQTNLADYAAGLCYQNTNGGVSQGTWYLPAICQMGAPNNFLSCPNSKSSTIDNLVQLDFSNTPATPQYYWSSTELAGDPQAGALVLFFVSGGRSQQSAMSKSSQNHVRCTRTVTFD